MNVQRSIKMGLYAAKRTINSEYRIGLPVIAKAFEDELRARIGSRPEALGWQVAENTKVVVASDENGTEISIIYPHCDGLDLEKVDKEFGLLILDLENDIKEAGRRKRLLNILA